jgi:hypothetical protein
MEAIQQTVQVPRVVQKQVPVVYTQKVPRVVCMRVPVEDPCAPTCCGSSAGVVLPAAAPVQVVPTPAAPPTGTFAPAPAAPTPAPAPPSGTTQGTQGQGQNNATKKPELGPEEQIGPVDDAAPAEPAKSDSEA